MKIVLSLLILMPLWFGSVTSHAQNGAGNVNMYNDSLHLNNIISYDFLGPAFRRFSVSYERLLFDGKFAVRVPWSIGYGYIRRSDPKWSVGIEPKFYPLGQRTKNYVFSFLGQIGETNGTFSIDYFYAVYAKNAYVFYPLDNLSFSIGLGIGFNRVLDGDQSARESAFLEMTVDYRF